MRPPLVVLLVLLVAGCAARGPAAVDPSPEVPPVNGTQAAPVVPAEFAAPPPAASAAAAPCPEPRAVVAHRGNESLGPAPAALCVFRTDHVGGENTLGVCPATGAVYAGNTYEVGRGGGAMVTRDEGATWEFLLATLPAGGAGAHQQTLDPYLYVDPTTCRVYLDDLTTPTCDLLSWTDDGGATWTSSLAGCAAFDHQTLFAGPPVTSATIGYPNLLYRCSMWFLTSTSSLTNVCQRSLDGGLTWLAPGSPAFPFDPMERGHNHALAGCDGAHGHGVADATGRVWLPKGCSQPRIAWSDDEGITWERATVSERGMSMAADGLLDHEGAVAVDAAGVAYYAWIAADHLPHLAVSSDRGASWQEPIAIAPAGLSDSALPALAVTPEGIVGLSYYGSYDAPPPVEVPPCEADPVACAQRALLGVPAPDATWVGHVALVRGLAEGNATVWTGTTGDAPLVKGACGPIRCQEAFDFQDLQMAPDGAAWATFVDVVGDAELLVTRLG